MRRLWTFLRLPVDDYLAALDVCVAGGFGPARIVVLLVSLAIGWWVYVPIHEILHALGCIVAGGTVSKLEIDAVYGAALLREVFPFVSVGSEYAGRLSGFDTGGSDLVYLSTDILPFVLTVLIGVPLLRAVPRRRERPLAACAQLGLAIPVAYAPFISFVGDYYEMGSILVSRLIATISPGFDPARWRSDDTIKLVSEMFAGGGGGTVLDGAGIATSLAVGAALMFGTYALGALAHSYLTSLRLSP